MSSIFFTSDLHLKHSKLIEKGARKFKDIEEHDNTIITNWNNTVKRGDIVYILGDVCWDGDYSVLKKLKGQKTVIKGNHDREKDLVLAKKNNYIADWCHSKTINIKSEEFEKVLITMSHFPMRMWDRSFHGSILLYGHAHGSADDYNLSTDVGLDIWNFTPVSSEQIIKYFTDGLREFKRKYE